MINSSIPGWKSIADLKEVEYLIEKIPDDGLIVDVGAGFGRNTWVMAKSKPMATVYAVDVWTGWDITPYLESCEGDVCENLTCTYDWFYQFTKDCPNIIPIKERSPFLKWNYPKIDMVYIDVEHDYDTLMKQLSFWYDNLKSTGIMAGHDYGPGSEKKHPGVKQAVDYFALSKKKKVVQRRGWTWFLESKIL